MVTTTTNHIEGHKIVKYKKILTEFECACGKLCAKEGEPQKNISELSKDEFEAIFTETTHKAFRKLVALAESLGANAVIGCDTEYKFCGPDNETLMVIVKGTAAIVDISYY